MEALLGNGEKLKLRSLCRVSKSGWGCPLDGANLGEGRIGPVTVDSCLSCHGLCLDPGELEFLRKRRKVTPYWKPEAGREFFSGSDQDGSEVALVVLLLEGISG